MSYRTEIKNYQPKILTRRELVCLLGAAPLFAKPFSLAHASTSVLKLTPGQKPLPETALPTRTGKSLRLAEAVIQPLLVNFWATWCGPCVVELPALERAAGLLQKQNITVVLVSIDRGGAEVAQPFLDQRNIRTPISAYDPEGEWARNMQIRGLPTTLLIKAHGTEYAAHTGPAEWDSKAVLAQTIDYLT